MRITIVTGPFYSPPPAPGGAVERLWFHLARHFAQAGHEVHFLSKRHPSVPKVETIDGVQHRRLTNLKNTRSFGVNLGLDGIYSLRMLAALPKADVLVTNVFWLPTLARRLRRGAGRISVNVNRMPKGQMFLYRGCDRVVGVSSAVSEAIVAEQPRLEPIVRTIPNPFDADTFCPAGGFPNDEPSVPTIVYTGRVHEEKGIDLLCDAFRRLRGEFPTLRLRIIGAWRVEDGGGGAELRRELLERAGEGAEMVEPIYDRKELADAIRSGTVYCYPSRADRGEAFPTAPLEAMGCGRVPVVSDLPQFDDYIRDGENGVRFDHRGDASAERLAEALGEMLRDPERRHRLAAAAAETATHYSFPAVAQMYLDDFAEMLGQQKAVNS